MKKSRASQITQTAIFMALLLVLQSVTKPLGQFVTGASVNFVLIASVTMVGLLPGIVVAALSPFFAYMLGIGPAFIQLIPMIAIGNIVLVLCWHFIMKKFGEKTLSYCIAAAVGALAKFVTLYLGVVKLVIPFFMSLPEKQAAAISVMFGTTQLVTALLGGVVAIIVVPLVKKAVKK